MERVKGFSRKAEPSAMEAVNPIVAKAEHTKPDQEDYIVEDKAVKQKLFDGIWVHGGASRILKVEIGKTASNNYPFQLQLYPYAYKNRP